MAETKCSAAIADVFEERLGVCSSGAAKVSCHSLSLLYCTLGGLSCVLTDRSGRTGGRLAAGAPRDGMVHHGLGGRELDCRCVGGARGLGSREGDTAKLYRILPGCLFHRNMSAHSGLWRLALVSAATSSCLLQTRRVCAG